MTLWLVRAGSRGEHEQNFLDEGRVYVAWEGLDVGWSEADILERSIFATRQLAKRQITWLRSMPERLVVAADGPDALNDVWRSANPLSH